MAARANEIDTVTLPLKAAAHQLDVGNTNDLSMFSAETVQLLQGNKKLQETFAAQLTHLVASVVGYTRPNYNSDFENAAHTICFQGTSHYLESALRTSGFTPEKDSFSTHLPEEGEFFTNLIGLAARHWGEECRSTNMGEKVAPEAAQKRRLVGLCAVLAQGSDPRRMNMQGRLPLELLAKHADADVAIAHVIESLQEKTKGNPAEMLFYLTCHDPLGIAQAKGNERVADVLSAAIDTARTAIQEHKNLPAMAKAAAKTGELLPRERTAVTKSKATLPWKEELEQELKKARKHRNFFGGDQVVYYDNAGNVSRTVPTWPYNIPEGVIKIVTFGDVTLHTGDVKTLENCKIYADGSIAICAQHRTCYVDSADNLRILARKSVRLDMSQEKNAKLANHTTYNNLSVHTVIGDVMIYGNTMNHATIESGRNVWISPYDQHGEHPITDSRITGAKVALSGATVERSHVVAREIAAKKCNVSDSILESDHRITGADSNIKRCQVKSGHKVTIGNVSNSGITAKENIYIHYLDDASDGDPGTILGRGDVQIGFIKQLHPGTRISSDESYVQIGRVKQGSCYPAPALPHQTPYALPPSTIIKSQNSTHEAYALATDVGRH